MERGLQYAEDSLVQKQLRVSAKGWSCAACARAGSVAVVFSLTYVRGCSGQEQAVPGTVTSGGDGSQGAATALERLALPCLQTQG